MPELPEVETIRRDLSKLIIGKNITKVILHKEKIVKSSAAEFIKILTGNKIKKINRRGKLLFAELVKGGWLLIHLKMTGQLIYQKDKDFVSGGHSLTPPPSPSSERRGLELPNKHTHVILEFTDQGQLFFNDMRQFGYMKLVAEKELEKILSKYGIEPLARDFTWESFHKVIKNKTTPIKAVLLNQNHISGIGNIYADETCFAAGILPSRRANKLTIIEIKKLYQACQTIIKKAIDKRGTTFHDYRDAGGKSGNFVKYLKVYGRSGKKCLRCQQAVIKKSRLVGRGTTYCLVCQK